MGHEVISKQSRTELLRLLSESEERIQLLLNQNQQLQTKLDEANASAQALLSKQDNLMTQVENLTHQLQKLQQLLFGQRSEKQRQSATNINKSSTKSGTSDLKNNEINSSRNGRKSLPRELPRKVMKHELPEEQRQCPHCEGNLHCIGKDVSEQLDYIPAQLWVIEHRRYKYGCRCCQKITMAPQPANPIHKGLAGCGLLAELLINKYQEHLPLYRLEKRTERLGYKISRSTLCDWVMGAGFELTPIVDAMAKDVLARSGKIHSDDTIIPVQQRDKTHKGRLWVYIGGGLGAPPAVIYQYTKNRRGTHPKTFLSKFQGYLQADAYAGYDQCYESGDIIEVACMAHARRKFIEAQGQSGDDGLASIAVDYIGQLYGIETRAKSMTEQQRYYYRKKYAKPILKHLSRWLIKTKPQAPPKSPLGVAINYALNHWKALGNYLLHGILSIDNNIAERAMKSVVLGRKNYLFAGSHLGAQRAATIYSLIETCKALHINAFDYLRDVLARLPNTLNKDIAQLFPYNWKPKIQPETC